MNKVQIQRTELFGKLNERLTVVTAPAGFGKTSFIQNWCKQRGIQSFWLTLKLNPRYKEQFWTELKKRIKKCSRTDSPVLIIDDFHVLEQEIDVAKLLEMLPQKIKVILISRHQLEICANTISTEELRLKREESLCFFEKSLGYSLSESEFSLLHEWSRGWLACMQLLVLIVNQFGNVKAFDLHFRGEHSFFNDFFYQVLKNEPVKLKAFLLQTASMKTFNHDLCEALFERNQLEEIRRRSLFLLNHNGEYQYEPIFQSFLMRELMAVPEMKKRSWYDRVSDWYAKEERLEAIDFAIMANQYEKAASLIIRFASRLFASEYTKPAVAWKDIVRRLQGEQKVQILLFYGWIEYRSGSFEELNETLRELKRVIRKTVLPDGFKGELLLLRSLNTFVMKDVYAAIDLSKAAFSLLSDGGVYLHKGIILNDREAQLIRGQNGLNGCVTQVLYYFESFEKNQCLFSEGVIGYGKCIFAEAAYETNNVKAAYGAAKEAVRIGFETNHLSLLVPSVIIFAKTLQKQGRNGEAFQVLERAKQRTEGEDRLWAFLLMALEIRMYIKKKEIRKAHVLVHHLIENSQGAPEQMHEFESLTYARMLIEIGDFDRAELFLEELLFDAESSARYGTRIEILILQSIVNGKRKRILKAEETLKKALPFAEKEDYVRTFLDEGKPLYDLLSRMRDQSAYVRNLLQRFEEEYKFSSPVIHLTRRERDILRLIGEGKTNKELATEMNITEGTVKGYASSLFKKLNVNKRTQAVIRAKEMNLL